MEAELNMNMFVDFQSKAIETCRTRCVNEDYKFDNLGRAEAVCTDRCIAKFFETSQVIQEMALEQVKKRAEMMKEMAKVS